MRSTLEGRHRDPDFLGRRAPTVLLDEGLVIRAATRSYQAVTGRKADELVSVNLFDAFPENQATRQAGSGHALTDAVQSVLRTGQPNHLTPLRYDIPDQGRPGEFLERRWVVLSSPVRDGDLVIGVSFRVHDVTPVDEDLLVALRGYRDVLADGDLRTTASRERVDVVSSFIALMESRSLLAAEVDQLREALTTRPTIDQAKGIVMADRGCGPDEAFALLRQLSMDSNVRVSDVAAALVYQVQHP